MPRPSLRRSLSVWMNGLRVGTWSLTPSGEHVFEYVGKWLQQPEARALSHSLPLRADRPYRGAIVEAWFDNLLPDSRDIRQRIRSRFGAASTHAFDLLTEIGRDCVGAVQLLPGDSEPADVRRIQGTAMSKKDVAALLRATPVSAASSGSGDFRISLAGAQEKTALLWHDRRWHRPQGATPTTHIFKLPLGRVGNFQGDLSTSVENEWLCSQIVAAFGLPVARTEIGVFEDQKVLIVERFDRRLADDRSHWLRLPQEDLCQALAVPPSLKYEADHGPGPVQIMQLLLGSRDTAADRTLFLKALFVFWLLGATDGHAKNFSVTIEAGSRFRMTPLYDILSVWPLVGRRANQLAIEHVKMAMALVSRNRHYQWTTIQPRHWTSTAAACGYDVAAFEREIAAMLAQVEGVIDRVERALPSGFPIRVAEPIFLGLRRAADTYVGRRRRSTQA